jgi:hypothetical protein
MQDRVFGRAADGKALFGDGLGAGWDDPIPPDSHSGAPAVRCGTTADTCGQGVDVDDAPYTGDLDLGAASTRDDLAALLQTVHIRADKPSLRTLEARTRHGATPLSKTAVAEMLKGVRVPRKAVMVAFLRACGVQDDGMESWLRTWERVASGEGGPARPEVAQSRVVITAAQDLTQRDVANHLVLIGGLTRKTVTPWFSRIFPIPIEAEDRFDRSAILVRDPDSGTEREFKNTLVGDELVEDVGFFARGENPSAPRRTLTICDGITTRGVHGAARCFIDWEMRERNEQYLMRRFPDRSTYCIVMRVPVVNEDPLTPDLSKKENRLFEWCDASTKTE